jgi:hypothetical protein
MYIVNPVRLFPLKVAPVAPILLYAFEAVIAVTKIAASCAVVGTDNPMMSLAVISLATGFTVEDPILMFGAENIPVPVIFAKVTSLVVAMLCGRLSVTAPVLALAVTWLAVPVIELTGVTH